MRKKLTTVEFINKAKEVHGGRYDYSKVDYIHTDSKVCIICPIHGEFEQTPKSHLRGVGCTICGFHKSVLTRTKILENFVKEAREIHGDVYDYSFVKYKNTHTKVKILCKNHGYFWQLPKNHIPNST